jgi:hypothetical protein
MLAGRTYARMNPYVAALESGAKGDLTHATPVTAHQALPDLIHRLEPYGARNRPSAGSALSRAP